MGFRSSRQVRKKPARSGDLENRGFGKTITNEKQEKVGFSVSVPNAHVEVKELADFVTIKSGGQGVLVEIVKHILKSKGIYNSIFEKMRTQVYGV